MAGNDPQPGIRAPRFELLGAEPEPNCRQFDYGEAIAGVGTGAGRYRSARRRTRIHTT